MKFSPMVIGLVAAFAVHARADILPDPAVAGIALAQAPAVLQARAELAAQRLQSESLQRGREEWALSTELARRRIQTVPGESQGDWGVGVSRPLRLPLRAQADRGLAAALTARAEARVGEALHESGRRLLALWFDWRGAASQALLWQGQLDLAAQQLATVEARIRLGEAPRAERVNAEAALAQVRLQQQQAELRVKQARSRLQVAFPALPPGPAGRLPAPAAPGGTADAHVDAVLAHNHELALARRQAEALQAEARQLATRRGVDPSVGVFYRSEAGGDERVLGLSVGLTLPGPARRLDQAAAEALSASAQDAVARLELRLREEARADFEAAIAQAANWAQADRAAQALEEAARLAARAYSLGEGGLDAVLLARRLALDGRLQAEQAMTDALAVAARLQLDAHRLWPLDLDADDAHAHP